jgi:hypothetical protein
MPLGEFTVAKSVTPRRSAYCFTSTHCSKVKRSFCSISYMFSERGPSTVS